MDQNRIEQKIKEQNRKEQNKIELIQPSSEIQIGLKITNIQNESKWMKQIPKMNMTK